MNDLTNDNLVEANGENSATAVADIDNVAGAEYTGPGCEKCGAQFKASTVTVCRRCGWYANLNQFVEVDQDYERFHDDALPLAKHPKPSHLEIWMSLLPAWSWVLIATFVAIVAESVAARFFTEADSVQRMWWSLGQLAVGALAFVSCHVFNFLVHATEDSDVGFLDVLIRPLALWLRAFRALPKRLWVTDGALAGATATLTAILIIGSIPYDAMFDWGVKHKKPNLLAAVVQQAHKMPAGQGSLSEAVGGAPAGGAGSAKSLEEAVGDAAEAGNAADKEGEADSGKGAAANEAKGDEAKKADTAKPEEERKKIVCVILGYRLDAQRRISALVLGASHEDKLAYAGIVTPPTEDASLIDLVDDLQESQIAKPDVPLYVDATWVLPKYVCQVSYLKREADGRLIDVQWEKLRGTLTQRIYARPASPISADR